jgi:hypothetical protein
MDQSERSKPVLPPLILFISMFVYLYQQRHKVSCRPSTTNLVQPTTWAPPKIETFVFAKVKRSFFHKIKKRHVKWATRFWLLQIVYLKKLVPFINKKRKTLFTKKKKNSCTTLVCYCYCWCEKDNQIMTKEWVMLTIFTHQNLFLKKKYNSQFSHTWKDASK